MTCLTQSIVLNLNKTLPEPATPFLATLFGKKKKDAIFLIKKQEIQNLINLGCF